MKPADIIRDWERAASSRNMFDQHWEELARVMNPRRIGFVTEPVQGQSRMEDVYDSTAMMAARGLANAIGGMLRPEGQPWFFVKVEDDAINEDEEARRWLAMAQERLKSAFDNPKARFRQATGEADLDLVVFGSALLWEGVRSDRGGIGLKSIPLKDGWVRLNDDGMPSIAYRRESLYPNQAQDKFGDDVGPKTKELLRSNNKSRKVQYLHAVHPNEEGEKGAMMARNLPFKSAWIEIESKEQVQESGFHEFPYIFPRWDTSSGEDYGRSAGMIALPDTNTLQAMEETNLVAGQRAATPPLLAPNDGSFNAANTFPDGITYYDAELAREMGSIPIRPLDTGARIPLTMEMQAAKRDQVFAAFFRNVLNLPVDRPQMTATEVIERKEEFIREIGPVFGRLESDYTAPMVERGFNVMLRNGGFGPVESIPEQLRGQRVRFEFESPVKKIRQRVEAAAAQALVAETLEISQVDPSVLDNIDLDSYVRFRRESDNIPYSILRPEDQVAAIRQSRAEQQQQQQQLEQAQQIAETASNVVPMNRGRNVAA